MIATRSSQGRQLRAWPPPFWLVCAIVGFSCASLTFALVPSPLNHFGSIDALLYQSYIYDYKLMLDAFGYTYYSTRISWILPASLINYIFGDEVGYFLIRTLLLGSSATAFAILTSRFCHQTMALYGAAWFAAFPLIIRAFAHDYVDGAAIAYAVIATACVLTAKPRAYVAHSFGGFFFALSVNAYPVAALVPLTCALPWALLRKRCSAEDNVFAATVALVGFAAGYALIWLVLKREFDAVGEPFELVPLTTISSIATGAGEPWFHSFGKIFLIKGEYFKLLPAALAVSLFGIYRLRGYPSPQPDTLTVSERDDVMVLLAMIGGLLVTYLVMHFVLHNGVISSPSVFLFTVPACGLSSLLILDRLLRGTYALAACGLAIGLMVIAVAVPAFEAFLVLAPKPIWLALTLLATLAGVAGVWGRLVWLRGLAALGLLLAPLGFHGSVFGLCGFTLDGAPPPSYVACMEDRGAVAAEKDLREGIFQLLADLRRSAPFQKPPGLWYANDTGYADQVGAAVLYLYSRISSLEGDDPGMPVLNEHAREQLSRHDDVVLIGRTEAEIAAGLDALKRAGYAVIALPERRAGGQAFAFHYQVLRIAPAA